MAGSERKLNRSQERLLARHQRLQEELRDMRSKLAAEGLLQPARSSGEADQDDEADPDYDAAVKDLIDLADDREFYKRVAERYGDEVDDWAMGDSDVDLIDHIEGLDYQRVSIPEARNQRAPDPTRPIPSIELPEPLVVVSPYVTAEKTYTFDWPRSKRNDPGYQRSYLEIVARKAEEGRTVDINWH